MYQNKLKLYLNYHKIPTHFLNIRLVSFFRLVAFCEYNFKYFFSADAAYVLSSNINVNHGNVQAPEVKAESDEFFPAGIITNMVDNNSRQDTVVPKSEKYVLKLLYTI